MYAIGNEIFKICPVINSCNFSSFIIKNINIIDDKEEIE